MKTFVKHFKHIVSCLLLSIAFSCSDDFLNDNSDMLINPDNQYYAFYISPEWEAGEYLIYCPDAGDAEFSISNAPDWLVISDVARQFIGGVAYISCEASTRSEYDKVGIYTSLMILDVEGIGKYPIMVCYLNEGTPAIAVEYKMDLEYNSEKYLDITNKGEGILIWDIVSYPKWLRIDLNSSEHLLYIDYSTGITVAYDVEYPLADLMLSGKSDGKLTGQIVLASNDKKNPVTAVEVTLDMGHPQFDCRTDDVDFGRVDNEQMIHIENNGSGFLIWKIEDAPEWITFSMTQDVLYPYDYSYYIKATCDRSRMSAGMNYDTVTIKTNDPENPLKHIPVKCRNGNSEDVKEIAGTVTDVWLDKQLDILYISTKQPNRLLLYNINTKTEVREIPLTYIPNCFSLSADKLRMAVGHDGRISYIDLNQYEIIKSVEVGGSVFDIEWGAGDWCCYTPGTAQYCNLKWINAVSDEQYETYDPDTHLHGESVIKKIPNKNYIVASCRNYWQEGITVFNSQTREYAGYFNETVGQFWLSSDGNYLFASYGNVYRTSDLSAESLSPFTQLQLSELPAQWIDHNPATGSLWVICEDYYEYSNIWQLETDNYTLVNTFVYDGYYVTEVNDVYESYRVKAHYVFNGSSGSDLVVIKNLTERGNLWLIEHVTVNN